MADFPSKARRLKLSRPAPPSTEPLMRALKAVHTLTASAASLEQQRRSHELLGHLVTPMRGMDWSVFDLDGIPAAWTRPERGHDRRHAVLYCHGGGYTCGSLGYARILSSKLAYVTGFDVLSFGYRLSPEHPYPAAVEDAERVWDYLMHLGYGARDVLIAGDSAGGNLALVLAMKLRDEGRLSPRALILMSPWTDMTASGLSYAEHTDDDPMLTADYIAAVRTAYAPDGDYTDPALSPLFGDLSHLPPTLIQVGEHEILQSDSVRLRDRMVAAGTPCRLEMWKDMWHVFQMFPIKKASDAMDHIGRFLIDLF